MAAFYLFACLFGCFASLCILFMSGSDMLQVKRRGSGGSWLAWLPSPSPEGPFSNPSIRVTGCETIRNFTKTLRNNVFLMSQAKMDQVAHDGEGNEEIQFMPELWRFEREKGGRKPQSTVVRKDRGSSLTPFLTTLFFGIPFLPFLSQTSRVQA